MIFSFTHNKFLKNSIPSLQDMNYYKSRRNKKHDYNSSDGELLVIIGLIFIIWTYINSSQLIVVGPNINAEIYSLGEYLSKEYNSSSFECQKGDEIIQGLNITYPENSTKQYILSFYSSENYPNYHQISHLEKLDFSSNDCHWNIDIENKYPNSWSSRFEISPGVYRPIFFNN